MIYIGHSQGTTQWFVANSLDEDLSQYFRAFVGLAPVTYINHQISPLVSLLYDLDFSEVIYDYFDKFLYVAEPNYYGKELFHYFPRFSWGLISMLVGFDTDYHIDLGQLPVVIRNDVGGSSAKNIMHWYQNMMTD